jgi:hypothetical protein
MWWQSPLIVYNARPTIMDSPFMLIPGHCSDVVARIVDGKGGQLYRDGCRWSHIPNISKDVRPKIVDALVMLTFGA